LGLAPTRYDGNAFITLPPYDINPDTYLPGGSGFASNNSLPVACNNFIYLKVIADLTAIGLSAEYEVYVPCYFPS
jgi:hypothetical protein